MVSVPINHLSVHSHKQTDARDRKWGCLALTLLKRTSSSYNPAPPMHPRSWVCQGEQEGMFPRKHSRRKASFRFILATYKRCRRSTEMTRTLPNPSCSPKTRRGHGGGFSACSRAYLCWSVFAHSQGPRLYCGFSWFSRAYSAYLTWRPQVPKCVLHQKRSS